jgi:hypothetical protein
LGKAEKNFIEVLRSITRVEERTFPWLKNTFDTKDPPISRIFTTLNGDFAGLLGKRESRLRPDAFLPDLNCLLEFDEVQHFTDQRATALSLYPRNATLGFDREDYITLCKRHGGSAKEKGAAGYRRPTSEFPFLGGRHCQRALFDTLRDLLPLRNGLSPTLRIPEFEVLDCNDLRARILQLLAVHTPLSY